MEINLQNRNLSEYVNSFLDKLITFINNSNELRIECLLALGSLAKNNLFLYSDINLAIIHSMENDNELKKQLKSVFQESAVFNIEDNEKVLYYFKYIDGEYVKSFRIEIYMLNTTQKVHSLIFNSDLSINDFDAMVLVSKSDKILNIIKNSLISSERRFDHSFQQEIIEQLISKFVDNFERASSKFDKTDLLAIMEHLNVCYIILAKLDLMLEGEFADMFSIIPDRAFSKIHWKKFPFYKKNAPEPSIIEITNHRIRYLEKFYLLLDQLSLKYSIQLDLNKVKNFLDFQVEKNPIWNMRDISYIESSRIQPKGIFRSSTLSRYGNKSYLIDLIEKKGIKSIIDLRSSIELKNQPYIDISELNVSYYNILMGNDQKQVPNDLKYSKENSKEYFYEVLPRYYQNELKEYLEIVAKCEFPAVIHCYAGKDRTGMLIAIILEILGIERNLIIEDYLNTGHDTSIESMNVFYKVIDDDLGGFSNFLTEIGVTIETVEKIREKLLK